MLYETQQIQVKIPDSWTILRTHFKNVKIRITAHKIHVR